MLADYAPRLGRAHAQMVEIERVLGWARDRSWTGGFDVLVSFHTYYVGLLHDRDKPQWAKLERVVQGDAAPYPVRAYINACDYDRSFKVHGQWAFWEVQEIRCWHDSPPHELFAESYPDFPYPISDQTKARINAGLERLAKERGIKPIITNDMHEPRRT